MDENMIRESREDRLLRGVLLAYFINGWIGIFGSLLPFFRQAYSLSYDQAGLMLSFRSVGNLVSMVLWGLLALRLGRRRSILLTVLMMVGCYALLASGWGTPALLMAVCLVEGTAMGCINNFSNTVISTLPGEKATRGFNLLHGVFAIGAFLSPLALVALTTLWPRQGWQVMTFGLCLLGLGQGLVYARMEMPPEAGGEKGSAADLSFLRDKRFWLTTVMLFFYLAVEYTIMGWLVTYFRDAGILSPRLAQVMSSLLWLLMFLGRMVGAAVTGKVSRGAILVVDAVGLLGFYLLMISSQSPVVVVIALAGVGAFMATLYPTAFAFGSDAIKGNDLGCSVMNLVGAVGGAIAPSLVGLAAERTGKIQSGMTLVAVGMILLLFSILVSLWSVRREKKQSL